jgi:hypothetical protein
MNYKYTRRRRRRRRRREILQPRFEPGISDSKGSCFTSNQSQTRQLHKPTSAY